MPKKIWKIDKFHGGLNSSASKRDVADNELTQADNIMVDQVGIVRTMGTVEAHASDDGTPNSPTLTINPGSGLTPWKHDSSDAHTGLGDLHGGHATTSTSITDAEPALFDGSNDHFTDAIIGKTVYNKSDGSSAVITRLGAGPWEAYCQRTVAFTEVWPGHAYTDMSDDGGTGDNCAIVLDSDKDVLVAGQAIFLAEDALGTGYPAADTTYTPIARVVEPGSMAKVVYIIDLDLSPGLINGNSSGPGSSLTGSFEFKTGLIGGTANIWFKGTGENRQMDKYYIIDLDNTEDDYLILTDSDTSADLAIYSKTKNEWGEGDLLPDLGDKTMKPVFYNVDGSLRIGDASFNNPTQYYSYIKRTLFADHTNETKSDPADCRMFLEGWYSGEQEIKAPTYGNIVAEIGYGTNHYANAADIDLIDKYSVCFDDNITVGQYDVYDIFSDLYGTWPKQDGVTLWVNYALHYDGMPNTPAFWKEKWYFGVSFIYDEKQISSVTYAKDTSGNKFVYDATADNFATINRPLAVGAAFQYYDQYGTVDGSQKSTNFSDKRITGFDVWAKPATFEQGLAQRDTWYHVTNYNFVTSKVYNYCADSLHSPEGGLAVNNADGSDDDPDWYFHTASEEQTNLISTPPETYETYAGRLDEDVSYAQFKTAIVTNRKAYIGNVKIDGEIMGDAMIKSPVNQFDIFTKSRMIEASVRDGDQIVALIEHADRILQFKKNKMHLINISQGGDGEFLEDTYNFKGISNPAAVCKTDYGAAWVNVNGAYLYDGQQVIDLLNKNGQRQIKEADWISFITDNSIVGYLPDKKHFIVLKDCTATSAGDVYIMDAVTRSWTFGDSQFADSKRRTNMITDWNGDIVIAQTTDSDDQTTDVLKWTGESAAQNIVFKTKEIDFATPARRKKIYKVYLSVTPGITSNVTISAVDQDGGSLTFDTTTVSGGESEHKVTAGGNNIKTLTLTLTGSTAPADFELNDISIVYREKGVK